MASRESSREYHEGRQRAAAAVKTLTKDGARDGKNDKTVTCTRKFIEQLQKSRRGYEGMGLAEVVLCTGSPVISISEVVPSDFPEQPVQLVCEDLVTFAEKHDIPTDGVKSEYSLPSCISNSPENMRVFRSETVPYKLIVTRLGVVRKDGVNKVYIAKAKLEKPKKKASKKAASKPISPSPVYEEAVESPNQSSE